VNNAEKGFCFGISRCSAALGGGEEGTTSGIGLTGKPNLLLSFNSET